MTLMHLHLDKGANGTIQTQMFRRPVPNRTHHPTVAVSRLPNDIQRPDTTMRTPPLHDIVMLISHPQDREVATTQIPPRLASEERLQTGMISLLRADVVALTMI
jgi:hypothetical protein